MNDSMRYRDAIEKKLTETQKLVNDMSKSIENFKDNAKIIYQQLAKYTTVSSQKDLENAMQLGVKKDIFNIKLEVSTELLKDSKEFKSFDKDLRDQFSANLDEVRASLKDVTQKSLEIGGPAEVVKLADFIDNQFGQVKTLLNNIKNYETSKTPVISAKGNNDRLLKALQSKIHTPSQSKGMDRVM